MGEEGPPEIQEWAQTPPGADESGPRGIRARRSFGLSGLWGRRERSLTKL